MELSAVAVKPPTLGRGGSQVLGTEASGLVSMNASG